jgi:membrane-bound ClpP family serine protease
MHSGSLMKYKILGTVLVLTGLYLIAKFKLHLWGLVLLFVGFYLAMKKGMKPR